MRIELRILSGARAGQSEVFEQQTILVGRKLTNDLRFDAHGDLDVSARHADIRERGGRWYVVDNGSTNGTFLNGLFVKGESVIKDGDIIAFGKNGPTVEVRAKGEATGSTPAVPRTAPRPTVKSTQTRMSTHERVAVAVREQTRGMKTTLVGSMIGLGALAIVAYWIGTREGSKQVAEMQRVLANAESTSAVLRDRVRTGDTMLVRALTLQFDSLRVKAQAAASRGNEAQIAAMKQEIERNQVKQQGLALLDFSAIGDRNDNAVAFLVSELDGQLFGGTAFSVTKGGLLVTNRHNVRSVTTGAAPTRLEVQFANTSVRLPARVVKLGEGENEDIALIQIERPGVYPTVVGVSASGNAKVGSPVVTIGFPLSLELPMDGNTVKTTLSAGTVSKHIPALLQIDAFGAHGLSGAPIFDSRGIVVGVVYGGPREDQQIVYAVPTDRLVAFMGELGKSIIR